MNFSSWLPQVLALIPSIGTAVVGLFLNRKKRIMSELDRLIELRDRCEAGSAEKRTLDAAVASVSKRLNEAVQRRVDGAGVAALVAVAVVAFGVMYPTWLWVFDNGAWYTWLVALPFTFIAVGFLAAGVPSMFTSDEEKEESERARKARKAARVANRAGA